MSSKLLCNSAKPLGRLEGFSAEASVQRNLCAEKFVFVLRVLRVLRVIISLHVF